jgi:plastocyanin
VNQSAGGWWRRARVDHDGGVRALRVVVAAIAFVVAGLVGLVGLVGCGASSSGSAAAAKVAPGDVLVANFAFTPGTQTIHVGESVTWTFDQPSAPHNVSSTSGPDSFFSGAPQGKGTYTHEFVKPGTYTYVCTVHPFMKGTIVVTQ